MGRMVGRLVLFVALVGIVAGCAPMAPIAPFRTSSSYEDAFRAAAQAAVAVGYQVKSSDSNTGVIAAEKVYRQNRFKTDYLYLNIAIAKRQDGSLITANVKNPAGVLFSAELEHDKFVAALRKELPDIKAEMAK